MTTQATHAAPTQTDTITESERLYMLATEQLNDLYRGLDDLDESMKARWEDQVTSARAAVDAAFSDMQIERLPRDRHHVLRYVAGVPGQCRPSHVGGAFNDLRNRGLIVLARRNQWCWSDCYDLTPAGENAMLVIGERSAR